MPILLDPTQFPHRVIGADSLVAVRSATLSGESGSLPLLSYAQNSFLGRVVIFAQREDSGPPAPIAHTNENAMAEALKCIWARQALIFGRSGDSPFMDAGRAGALAEGCPLRIVCA